MRPILIQHRATHQHDLLHPALGHQLIQGRLDPLDCLGREVPGQPPFGNASYGIRRLGMRPQVAQDCAAQAGQTEGVVRVQRNLGRGVAAAGHTSGAPPPLSRWGRCFSG